MRELHLFAGAGGGIYGGQLLGHEPVCAVEIEPYCRQVLGERQADGTFPPFPVYEDVRKFDGAPWRGIVDVVCGGFPCQPWSAAGKRKGTADPRHLWPEMARIISEVRPRYVFAENVNVRAFEEPWRDLRAMGYRVPPILCLSAADVGAPHLRKRWWMRATDTDSDELRQQPVEAKGEGPVVSASNGEAPTLADAAGGEPRQSPEREGRQSAIRRGQNCGGLTRAWKAEAENGWWSTERGLGRVADGVADRVNRLKALGNGQVPQCAAQAWRILSERDKGQPMSQTPKARALHIFRQSNLR